MTDPLGETYKGFAGPLPTTGHTSGDDGLRLGPGAAKAPPQAWRGVSRNMLVGGVAGAAVLGLLFIAAGIVVLLSGLSLVGSVQDAITGAPITGVARFFELLLMTGGIIAGHGRLDAALLVHERGLEIPNHANTGTVPVIDLAHFSEAQKRAYILADNRLAEKAGWDRELLAAELVDLQGMAVDLETIGFDAADVEDLLGPADGGREQAPPRSLADRFGVPPFTVLNAREGWWQERKRAWLALGIRSELGRGDNLLGAGTTGCFADQSAWKKAHPRKAAARPAGAS